MQDNSFPFTPENASAPTALCMASLGEAIRRARWERGLTQTDLAIATATSPTQIHRIETGYGEDMSLARFLRICTALSLSPDALLAAAGTAREGSDSGQK